MSKGLFRLERRLVCVTWLTVCLRALLVLQQVGSRTSRIASWRADQRKGGFGLLAPREHLVASAPHIGVKASATRSMLHHWPIECSLQVTKCLS
jgi:hypothetical protein